MQDKGLDFKHKEVVNITDGKRLGYVQDVCADLETGIITSIIVPGSNKLINIFSPNNDIVKLLTVTLYIMARKISRPIEYNLAAWQNNFATPLFICNLNNFAIY